MGTFGVMTAVPVADQSSPSAISEAVSKGFGCGAFGSAPGILVNVIFIGFFIFNTVVYIFYLCSIIGAVAMAWAMIVTFTNSWTTLIDGRTWLLWIGGIAVLSLAIGAVLYFLGHAITRADVSDEEIIAEVTGGKGVIAD